MSRISTESGRNESILLLQSAEVVQNFAHGKHDHEASRGHQERAHRGSQGTEDPHDSVDSPRVAVPAAAGGVWERHRLRIPSPASANHTSIQPKRFDVWPPNIGVRQRHLEDEVHGVILAPRFWHRLERRSVNRLRLVGPTEPFSVLE